MCAGGCCGRIRLMANDVIMKRKEDINMRIKGMSIKGALTVLFVLVAGLIFTGCDDEKKQAAEDKVAPPPAIVVENNVPDETGAEAAVASSDDAADEAGDDAAPADEDTDESSEDESSEDESSEDEKSEDEKSEDEKSKEDASDEEDEKKEDPEDETQQSGPVTPGSVENIGLNSTWKYADYSAINSGSAKLYRAADNRKGVVIGVNAGHGTRGGGSVKTYCHPDMSPKVTGGSTGAGAIKAAAVSGGMSFADGTSEASVTLREAQILRDKLLAKGYDVLMLRDDADVQLDNIARTVIANNTAACLISLHWDGDNLNYDKGCFYISTPEGTKGMDPVASHWQEHEALGRSLISGLAANGCKIYGGGSMSIDLTQTSYSTTASVDIELGNAASAHDDATLSKLADGLVAGITAMY